MVPNINLHFLSCVCLCICWPWIFGFTPQDTTRLFDIFDRLSPPVIMFNLNNWVFHTGGWGWEGSTPTCSAQHTYFHFQNRATHFGRCPMLPSPPLNTKHSVDQSCTHDIPSNTKHSVDFYHALTPMSCDVLVHNAMQSCHCSFIPCYIYDECYM